MNSEARFAQDIVRLFEPSSVLHLGCRDTKLIEELILRGIPAFGLTTLPVQFNEIPDAIADRIFMVNDLFTDSTFIPVYDLIVANNYVETIPSEDYNILSLFLSTHGERYFFHVKTKRQGGKHRIEWWQKELPMVFFDER